MASGRSDSDVFDADRLRFYPDECAWRFREFRDPAMAVWTLTWVGWTTAGVDSSVLAGNRPVASSDITAFLPAVVTGPP